MLHRCYHTSNDRYMCIYMHKTSLWTLLCLYGTLSNFLGWAIGAKGVTSIRSYYKSTDVLKCPYHIMGCRQIISFIWCGLYRCILIWGPHEHFNYNQVIASEIWFQFNSASEVWIYWILDGYWIEVEAQQNITKSTSNVCIEYNKHSAELTH